MILFGIDAPLPGLSVFHSDFWVAIRSFGNPLEGGTGGLLIIDDWEIKKLMRWYAITKISKSANQQITGFAYSDMGFIQRPQSFFAKGRSTKGFGFRVQSLAFLPLGPGKRTRATIQQISKKWKVLADGFLVEAVKVYFMVDPGGVE